MSARPIRVLHLAPHPLPLLATSGGIAVHRHAKALADAGLAVAVAIVARSLEQAPSSGQSELPECQSSAGFSTYTFGAQASLADLLALTEHWQPSVVHIHHVESLASAEAIATQLAISIVYTEHLPIGDPWLHARMPTLGPREAECMRRVARTIAFVPAGLARLAALVPEAADRIRVVGHGVEDRPDIEAIAAGRRASPDVDALFVGRFTVEKGIFDLLAAIPIALRQCPSLRFTLLGEGRPPASTPWSERVPAELRSRVRFLAWSDPATVERELAAADCLVAPSEFESFGMAVAEAMLFGLPCVVTPTEGLAGIVAPDCGRFVPAHQPGALAEAIVELAEHPDLRLAIGRRAGLHARATLTWAAVSRAMIEVYRELG